MSLSNWIHVYQPKKTDYIALFKKGFFDIPAQNFCWKAISDQNIPKQILKDLNFLILQTLWYFLLLYSQQVYGEVEFGSLTILGPFLIILSYSWVWIIWPYCPSSFHYFWSFQIKLFNLDRLPFFWNSRCPRFHNNTVSQDPSTLRCSCS